MVASRETVRDKLLIAVVNTFIFGALLAIFGYWLDTRLESYKQAVVAQVAVQGALLRVQSWQLAQRLPVLFAPLRFATQQGCTIHQLGWRDDD